MGDTSSHTSLMLENLKGARGELRHKRYSNVGLLSLRALEQMIEACAAKKGLHFHEHPRTAHRNRRNWLMTHHPDLVSMWDELWSIYGALGYGGVDGERAQQALNVLSKCLAELSRREKIAVASL